MSRKETKLFFNKPNDEIFLMGWQFNAIKAGYFVSGVLLGVKVPTGSIFERRLDGIA